MGKNSCSILALGSDVKSRFLFAKGAQHFFGPDIGDLGTLKNLSLFKKAVFKQIKGCKVDMIAYDLHPHYFSSRLRFELAERTNAALCGVQHHHAHIASVLAERGGKESVVGISCDGTGYGLDAHMWGGEFFVVKDLSFRRVAHFKYRKMPGGEKVIYEPWRMALSVYGKKAYSVLKGVPKKEMEIVTSMMAKNINSPLSSSVGRIFDAAAALLGVCRYATHEAEGPIKLQALCQEGINKRYEFSFLKENGCCVIDTDPLFKGMVKDLRAGESLQTIATKFHNSIAETIIRTVQRLSREHSLKKVILSGGVFQNDYLTGRVTDGLLSLGCTVLTNASSPVHDLNISLGQWYMAYHKDS